MRVKIDATVTGWPKSAMMLLLAIAAAILAAVGCLSNSENLHMDSTEVLLMVNGVEITEQQIAIAIYNTDWYVESFPSEAAEDSDASKVVANTSKEIENYGRVATNLGGLIRTAVVVSTARSDGTEPAPGLVTEMIYTHRAAVERMDHLGQLVDEAGTDAYWDYFEVTSRQLALVQGYLSENRPTAEAVNEWIRSAEIEIVNHHSLVGERTVEAAKTYLLEER